MTTTRPLSDLVRDKKIEAEVSNNSTKHVFYAPGRSAQERQIRSVEIWVRNACLGQGAFGTVYREKCEQGKRRNDFRAVKEIKKRFVAGEELDYTRELEAIIKFSNPKYSHCFVHCDGWFETTESVFISMEYVQLGDLQNYLTQPLYESDARAITSQVLEGLQIMHENDFVHRDLKPGNIMVVTKRPWFVKIADFGISKRRLEDVTDLRTLQRGTFGFAAPEIFGFGADSKDGSYTPAVDMWSLGAVTYKILTGLSPFPDLAMEIRYATEKSEFPVSSLRAKGISEKGQDFILRLMARVPKDRLTAGGAQDHDWLKAPVDAVSDEHLSTIDPSQQLSTGESFSSAGSGLWTFDDTLTKYPITRENPSSLQPGLAYKAPYLEEGPTELDQSLNNHLPKDSPVVLREATITTDSELKSSASPVLEAPTVQDDETLLGNRAPDSPERSSIDSSSNSGSVFTDSSSPGSPKPSVLDDPSSSNAASTSSPDPAVDHCAMLIKEAVNECSATFQVDRFIDSVENPNHEIKPQNYYATACLPLKTLLRSHPGLLISHSHVINGAIDDISDPDVRVMLRKAIDDIISGEKSQSSAKPKNTTFGCRDGYHDPTVIRPGTRCCHCSECENDKSTSSTNCFECGQVAMTDATVLLACLHRICHPCLKRKFWLSVRMPISRNMPPRCCTEDSIPAEDVKDLLDENFWREWEAEFVSVNAIVVRIWCPNPNCQAIVAFDRTWGREPMCPRCRISICPICDRPSHPERSCTGRVRIIEPTTESSEGRMGGKSRGPGHGRQNPDLGRSPYVEDYYVGSRPPPDDMATPARETRRRRDFPPRYSANSYHRPVGPQTPRRRWGPEGMQGSVYPSRSFGPEDIESAEYRNPYRDGPGGRGAYVYA